jgi:hypothetical protein
MCQNYQGRGHIGSRDVALKCARTHNIDWEESGVGQCIGLDGSGKGQEGVQLLHDSIRFAESLGITYVSVYLLPPSTSLSAQSSTYSKSCTVVINGEKVCIHDETWQRCEVSNHCQPRREAWANPGAERP